MNKEINTITKMISMYCKGNHDNSGILCKDCRELKLYAEDKLRRCPFKADKPACSKCTVHCYSSEKREQIRKVMRYSGPRMIFHHPVKAVKHMAQLIK